MSRSGSGYIIGSDRSSSGTNEMPATKTARSAEFSGAVTASSDCHDDRLAAVLTGTVFARSGAALRDCRV